VRLLQTLSNCIGALQSGNIFLINRSAVATSVRLDRCPLPACLPCPFVSRSVCGRRFSVSLKEIVEKCKQPARRRRRGCWLPHALCAVSIAIPAVLSTHRAPVVQSRDRPADDDRASLPATVDDICAPPPRKWPWYTQGDSDVISFHIYASLWAKSYKCFLLFVGRLMIMWTFSKKN